ncbi:hypothetical protein BLA24_18325 [Streptomyces cinnamoneus]|uniref:Uncharacterized protein n=1 Tax=Streptomyces cinnamoneus TaxID=53446 RepID=A0A2G1XHL6_STRCJ|nr:hypothetical protein [Streptomyces cinnamoneus]PHQ50738.1 hypothetical protein BLA24_18325 [Streptomyces cinnamoneus]
MPSFYEELMKADFSGLETLGGKWEEVHGKINGLPGRILDEVLKPLRDKGYWEGAAAPYAWTQIDDMQRQVESAAKVAESVAKVVKDGAGELKAVQRELKDAVDRIKQKTGFSVSHEGKVSYTGTIHADTQKDVDHAQDEIIEILRRAVVTDQNLSMSLMADVGVDTWFNAKPQLTDINHTGTLGIERYNQLGLALAGEDPTPSGTARARTASAGTGRRARAIRTGPSPPATS